MVRGLYRRSGISPCPEEIICRKSFRDQITKTDYKDTINLPIVIFLTGFLLLILLNVRLFVPFRRKRKKKVAFLRQLLLKCHPFKKEEPVFGYWITSFFVTDCWSVCTLTR
jgi:hypothetical protein